ncbi:hypothetical protein [Parasporobacterium paucivorans]|uniref:Uncharacterized protein n=1 Tax=Parasporobacterium paucivorans DSM 15970 TaxID=1122934 RepID=A0A1M6B7L6_9FIRM|nr:hypothetical protein [Parasporobacterium paucivorans]SHI44473.1 hypothetical protein SAMN02745691_00276 [Parasporobacterium paucivorans DSM 15970]
MTEPLKTAYRLITTEINGILECYDGKPSKHSQTYIYALEKAQQIIKEVAEQEKSPSAATEGQEQKVN